MIPCKEAGLEFQKGDILHIVDMEDRNWWQAKKEGDPSNRAGRLMWTWFCCLLGGFFCHCLGLLTKIILTIVATSLDYRKFVVERYMYAFWWVPYFNASLLLDTTRVARPLGLIPSRLLQERRVVLKNNGLKNVSELLPPDYNKNLQNGTNVNGTSNGTTNGTSRESWFCLLFRGSQRFMTDGLLWFFFLFSFLAQDEKAKKKKSKKMRKVMYHVDNSDDFDKDEVMTYEEVALFSPRSGAPRPLVLIGASGVGRNEIKRR